MDRVRIVPGCIHDSPYYVDIYCKRDLECLTEL